ncbi:MAG: HypC/HybG/HupF family hydrogenase formation chaperone [Patescibacteria group bacterium]
MCLTIPKKVISVQGDFIVIETPDGSRQKVKSLVKSKPGDFILTQGGIGVEKMEKNEALEILKYFNKKERRKSR